MARSETMILLPYNHEWKNIFEKEKELLLSVCKDKFIVIEHIGSTSVEGLGAKPIIDILIGIQKFSTANYYISPIKKLGYEYISEYEREMPYRKFFTKENNDIRTHHIHLVQQNSDFWKRHIFFRDHLRSNTKTRDDYFSFKKNLSKKNWKNINKYADAKSVL